MDFLKNGGGNLAPGVRDLVARLRFDAVRQLHSQQICRLVAGGIESPEKLVVVDGQPVDGVERPQDVFAPAQAQRPKEDRSQKLALTVDANVEHILLVVFEFHP